MIWLVGLKLFKKSFEKFSEANSMAIAINKFNNDYYPADFLDVNNFSTSYYTSGTTAVYYSICQGADQLLNYIKKVTDRNNCIPRATFIVFSDGEPYGDRANASDARKAIKKLNAAGVTTVFVAFGDAISAEFGSGLEFQSTVDVRRREALVNFLGVDLSKSCKEQSKSIKALGSNFFSQAANSSKSEKYSQKTKQALEDDDWFKNI